MFYQSKWASDFRVRTGSCGHLGAKIASRPLQEDLGTDFWTIFGTILGSVWALPGFSDGSQAVRFGFPNIVKVCVASVAVFHEYVVSLQTRAGELGVGDGESKLCPDTSPLKGGAHRER